ncbi:MAG: 2-hydroxyacid dehydrogenase [Thermotogae bacterium]|jgi:phosphoglycerate dehydrogenase-like enzyme|nr:2-hydroxyacid dehydrogenase [Thermotogota bacterium]MCL5032450.1 2-hydroxyacid dehydrogenase [Thermotogota bacterium]
MKIIFMNRLEEDWIKKVEALKNEFKDVEFIISQNPVETEKMLETADGAVGDRFSPDEISNAKNLKVIFVPWTGVNNLPWKEIKSRKVVVSNNHANAQIVAERAIALTLSLMGRIVEYHNDLAKGIWHGFSGGDAKNAFWTSLRGKSCGIGGMGGIGKEIAKLLKAFDCKTIGFKKQKTHEKIDFFDEVTFDLENMISKSDIIFIALPLTPQTKGIINRDIISKMKGKFLVNVSRGDIIDEKALYDGIKDGILAGAAIDTWYRYPSKETPATLPSSYPIHNFKNVVISPHVGSLTVEGVEGMADATIDNIRSYIKTGKPVNVANADLMY